MNDTKEKIKDVLTGIGEAFILLFALGTAILFVVAITTISQSI